MARTCEIGSISIGPGRPLAVIAGPCTLESVDLGLEVGRTVRDACRELGLAFVFKASFDKANRSSISSARGPGLAAGLAQLGQIRDELGVPITTDVHLPEQAEPAAEVVSMLQIPAFLCRQTDLLLGAGKAAGARKIAVNVKKGQFLSPEEMAGPVRKLAEAGCENVLLTERGTFFGYHRLVNDFIGVGDLMDLDCSGFAPSPLGGEGGERSEPGEGTKKGKTPHPDPLPQGEREAERSPIGRGRWSPPVCFDVTHSTQLPGSGVQTGGRPDRAPLLARAAVAAGVHAVFIECHPDPSKALSDGATQLPLADAPALLRSLAKIRGAIA